MFMNAIIEIEKDFDLTEIINGEEVMSPSPFGKHQEISGNLYANMRNYVKAKDLGHAYYSPLDVILEEGVNRLQPDILFIRKDRMGIFQDWVRGVPDMVCEIISTGTYQRDTATKKEIYEKYGVPEYWIIIPELKIVEVLTIVNDKYKTYSIAEGSGVVISKVIDGFQIDVNDIFE
ncbi:MAG: Uma2 family endonuclease [Nitrospirae bacterium]|nr:Uma2 family endonuclease [Nitrospirota bacterium]